MTLSCVALFLTCVFSQASEIDRVAEQLGHEDGEVRQKAQKRLLEIGETARAALERLAKGPDIEIQTRARAILATLDQTARRTQWLGPAWTVKLPAGEYALGNIPALLQSQIPVPIEIPSESTFSRVRVGADGIGAWSFLDRLCESHGNLALPLERPEGGFALVKGIPARAPTVYSGPFRIWIDKLTVEARNPYGPEWQAARMVLAIAWQPNVHPLSHDDLGREFDFKITDITDDKGLPLQLEVPRAEPSSTTTGDQTRECVWRSWKTFARPPAGLLRLGRVRGTVKMIFPADIVRVEFKNPTARATTTIKAGDYSIDLASCKRTDSGLIARIVISRRGGRQDRQGRVELTARFRDENIKMWGTGGKSYSFSVRSRSHSSNDDGESSEVIGFFSLKEDAEKLAFPFITDYFEEEIPFEFRDVELP